VDNPFHDLEVKPVSLGFNNLPLAPATARGAGAAKRKPWLAGRWRLGLAVAGVASCLAAVGATPAEAVWNSPAAGCQGRLASSGGGGLVSVTVNKTLGYGVANVGQVVYAKARIHAVARDGQRYNYYSNQMAFRVQSDGSGYSSGNTVVIGGTSGGEGDRYEYFQWRASNGLNYNAVRFPAGTRTSAGLYVWDPRAQQWRFDWLYSNVYSFATQWDAYTCYFT
jgi:hypothetical protein